MAQIYNLRSDSSDSTHNNPSVRRRTTVNRASAPGVPQSRASTSGNRASVPESRVSVPGNRYGNRVAGASGLSSHTGSVTAGRSSSVTSSRRSGSGSRTSVTSSHSGYSSSYSSSSSSFLTPSQRGGYPAYNASDSNVRNAGPGNINPRTTVERAGPRTTIRKPSPYATVGDSSVRNAGLGNAAGLKNAAGLGNSNGDTTDGNVNRLGNPPRSRVYINANNYGSNSGNRAVTRGGSYGTQSGYNRSQHVGSKTPSNPSSRPSVRTPSSAKARTISTRARASSESAAARSAARASARASSSERVSSERSSIRPSTRDTSSRPSTRSSSERSPRREVRSITVAEQQKRERRARRRRRGIAASIKLAITVGVVAVLAVGAIVFYQSSAFTITAIRVEGAERLSNNHLQQLASVPIDSTLLRVDTKGIIQRLLNDPWIAEARIVREFPSTLVLVITEQTPFAAVEIYPDLTTDEFDCWLIAEDGTWLVVAGDLESPVFISVAESDGYPRVTDVSRATRPAVGKITDDGGVQSALAVISEFSPAMMALVASISAPSANQITLLLKNNITVTFGSAKDVPAKETAIFTLLNKYLDTLISMNVRDPSHPSYTEM